MMHFVAFFITIAVLVMFLGSRQRADRDRYGIASTVLLVGLAGISALLTRGSLFFPAAALSLAILILGHRLMVNRFIATEEPQEAPAPVVRQENLRAHETWIVAALTAALVSGLRL